MSLADRLAKAQQRDRIAEVRSRVQERLVESLGPRLYDATLSDTELEGLVHQRLRELLDEEESTALRAGEAAHRPPDRRQRPGPGSAGAVRP